jgi:hypothetical protein
VKDRDDELAILERNIYGVCRTSSSARPLSGPKGFKKGEITEALEDAAAFSQWWKLRPPGRRKAMGQPRSAEKAVRRVQKRVWIAASRTRSRRCSAATNCPRA